MRYFERLRAGLAVCPKNGRCKGQTIALFQNNQRDIKYCCHDHFPIAWQDLRTYTYRWLADEETMGCDYETKV